jgi:hypothetical protein
MVGYGQAKPEYTSMVAVGGVDRVGLRSDGTVNTIGWNDYGRRNVGDWTCIVNIAAGFYQTAGVESDHGTVIAVGDNDYGRCNVGNWTDVMQVSGWGAHTVGLKSGGTVVAWDTMSMGSVMSTAGT